MSSPTTNAGLGLRAVMTAAVAAVVIVALRTHVMPVSGAHLAVLAGREQDSHLVTGWLWRLLPLGSLILGYQNRLWSAAALAIAVFALVAILRKSRLGFAGIVYGAVLLASPLAIGVMLDPLAGEDVVSIALFALMSMDVARLWTPGVATRCILSGALALQDPMFVPAAALYAFLSGSERGARLGQAACVLAAVGLRTVVAPATLRSIGFDETAGPATIIAAGVVLFGAGPLLLFAAKRFAEQAKALTRAPLVRSASLGAAAATMGAFSPTGDPSLYWLAGESALLAGLIGSAYVEKERGRGALAMVLACAFSAELLVWLTVASELPALATSRASDAVLSGLAVSNAARKPLCVVTNDAGFRHVLASGALFSLAPATVPVRVVRDVSGCLESPRGTGMVVVSDMEVTDWGFGGVDLMKAADIASSAQSLPVSRGVVWPRTPASTPTGEGAFAEDIPTPSGATSTFVIATGYSYTFPCTPPGGRLSFAVAPLPHAGAGYTVSVRADRMTRRTILAGNLHAQVGGSDAQAWQLEVVRLLPSAHCRSITFSIPAQAKVPGTWVAFAAPAVSGDPTDAGRRRNRS